MALYTPSIITIPWAANGQKATIPNATDAAGRASWPVGFPEVNALPLAAGGIPPNYLDFQGVLYALSVHAMYGQTGAPYTWQNSLDYPVGARVMGSNGVEYVAVAASGPDSGGATDPTTDTTNAKWTPALTTEVEKFRQMRIGTIFYPMSTTLEAGTMWADGSLALFEDYPEFAAKYQRGGFTGMVLPASATSEEQAAYPGKFVLNAAGTGLYLPRMTDLFIQNSGTSEVGAYVAAGLPGITGDFAAYSYILGSPGGAVRSSIVNEGALSGGVEINLNYVDFYFNASDSNSVYAASSTVQPPTVKLSPAIYLGRPA